MTLSKAVSFAADVAAVILCVGVAAYLLRSTAPRKTAADERERVLAGSYRPGDAVPALPGVDYSAAHRTLLIVTRSDCSFCLASFPFYQRLLAERQRIGKSVRIVFLSPREDIGAGKLLRAHRLEADAMVSYAPRELRVRVTPTLLLVDRLGQVINVWLGQATLRDEIDIQSKLFR